MVLTLAACGAKPAETPETTAAPAQTEAAPAAEGNLVGVAMPTKDLQRWNQDGSNMKAELEAAGYEVDLQYAANDVPTQVSQIENMIAGGCKVLVIASIDGEALGTVLEQAKAAGIPVIAYDRLIMNSDAVSYYATFDNWNVGVKQGEYIVEALDLANAPEGTTYNIEYITGDPGDNNINFFFDGAISVLQPYIDSGVLVTPSGQTEKAAVATVNWATDAAQSRFENILSTYYAADHITVIRDGATIETLDNPNHNIDEDRIIRGMVGRAIDDRFPKRPQVKIGDVAMEVTNWTVHHPLYQEKKVVDNVWPPPSLPTAPTMRWTPFPPASSAAHPLTAAWAPWPALSWALSLWASSTWA